MIRLSARNLASQCFEVIARGMLCLVLLIGGVDLVSGGPSDRAIPFFGGSIAFGLFFWFVRYVNGTHVDEVFENGDEIIMRHRGKERVVPYSQIATVRYTALPQPTITLTLKRSFGGDILCFAPSYQLLPHSQHPTAEHMKKKAAELGGARWRA